MTYKSGTFCVSYVATNETCNFRIITLLKTVLSCFNLLKEQTEILSGSYTSL